jgi:leucyl-tRNA synthetase
MYQARLAMPSSSLVIQSDPSQLTDENIAEAMKQMEQLQQVYADGAKGILTPTQYEEFIKWQRQMISLQAVTLIMSQQRFGNKGAAQPPAGNQTQTH